ncbi:MAG: 16S rRNA (guanine(527)-N(7))-methyltransferase RsmG [Phycisphaerales bacterium]|nr:16S rRNA (guanine(527)-N(7))-methyltransferase RsmG [Phycisphaerales bacterium]
MPITKYFPNISDEQILKIKKLEDLYKMWNNKINVISRKDINQIGVHHLLHSLSIAKFIDFVPNTTIVDIGCGGGLPSIPLAIFFPQAQFLLIDSTTKKIKVVEAIVQDLNLSNVRTNNMRIENLTHTQCDFCISRGVTTLEKLWYWSKPLLSKDSKNSVKNGLICLKGGDLNEEIAQCNNKFILKQSIQEYFNEAFFAEKYILYLKK